MTHFHVTCRVFMWRDSFLCNVTHFWETWLIALGHASWHDAFIWKVHEIMHFQWTWRVHMNHKFQAYRTSRRRVTWLILMWHDSFYGPSWHAGTWRARDMTHCYKTFVWQCTFMCDMTRPCVAWLSQVHMWHDSLRCDMTHCNMTCMWHDAFICDMTHSYVTWLILIWHNSCICDTMHSYVTWLIHVWHDSFMWNVPSRHEGPCRASDLTHCYKTFIRDMTHSYVT